MLGHRQLNMEDYTAILRRRKWALIIPAVLLPIIAYALCFIVPSQYTSQTVVLVEQPAQDNLVDSVVPEDLNQRLAAMQEQILSRTRLEALINRYGLYPKQRGKVSTDALVDRLQKNIVVSPVKPMAETNSKRLPGFTVKVTADTPQLAQSICNEVTSMFMEENLSLREQRAAGTTAFLSTQLADAKVKLDDQDAKLAAFKSKNMGTLPDDQQANLSVLTGLNTQLDSTTQALTRAEQDKAFADSMLSQNLAAADSGQNPESQEKQLSDLQTQLADLRSKYTEDYPDVIKVKGSIAELQRKIASGEGQTDSSAKKSPHAVIDTPQIAELRSQVHQYDAVIQERTAQQRDLRRQIAQYQSRVQLSPTVEEQYKQLTRDYQTALDFYNDLLKKRSESAMATDMQGRKENAQFRVLDPPNLPGSPSFPDPLKFTLGGIAAGLFFGVATALLIEARDKTLRTEKDVEFFLQLPTLALIPPVGRVTSPRRSPGTPTPAHSITGVPNLVSGD